MNVSTTKKTYNIISKSPLDRPLLFNTCLNFELYTDGSMITNGAINSSATLAKMVTLNETSRYTYA
jgi:hypothetical protein